MSGDKNIKINVWEYLNWTNRTFNMDNKIAHIKDKRGRRQVKLKHIFKLLMLSDSVGESSIRRKDFLGRKPGIVKLVGSRRKQTASDTTIHRVINGLRTGEVREMVYGCGKALAAKKSMSIKLASGKRVKAGVVDGSGFGKILASVFLVPGDETNWFLDAEFQEKHGKEMPSSIKMMERLAEEFGEKFVDYIIADGLYACRNFFNTCSDISVEGIVKTKEGETLNILKEAEEIIRIKPRDPGVVEHTKGFDGVRGCEYEAWGVDDLGMEGVEESLRVVKVRENYVKSNREEVFFVITQAKTLFLDELRELAHRRWCIENNGFRALNEQCGSKKLLTKDTHERFLLLLIQLLSFNILQLYRKISTDKECERTKFVFLPPFHAIRQALLLSIGALSMKYGYG